MYNIIKKAVFISISFLVVHTITKVVNNLRRKVLWIEFKNDVLEYGFLNAFNRACYNIGELKTLPFSEDRDIVIDKYVKRKNNINKLKTKLHIKDKRG